MPRFLFDAKYLKNFSSCTLIDMPNVDNREKLRQTLEPITLSEFMHSDQLPLGFSSLVPGPQTKQLYILWEHNLAGLPTFLVDLEKALVATGKRHFHICLEAARDNADQRKDFGAMWNYALADNSKTNLSQVKDFYLRKAQGRSLDGHDNDMVLIPKQLEGLIDIAIRRNFKFTAEVLDREVEGLGSLHLVRISELDQNFTSLYALHCLTANQESDRITAEALLEHARGLIREGITLCQDFHDGRNLSVASRVKRKLKESKADVVVVMYGHEHLEIPYLNRLEPGVSLVQAGIANSLSRGPASFNFMGFQGKIVDMLGAVASSSKATFSVDKLDDALFDTLVAMSMQWILPSGYSDAQIVELSPKIPLARNVIYRFLRPDQRLAILRDSANEFEALGDVPHMEIFAQHLQKALREQLLLPIGLAPPTETWRGSERETYAYDPRFEAKPIVDMEKLVDHFTRGFW